MNCSRGCCGSQADHYRGVALRPASPAKQAERGEVADMAAYRRLRQSGLQPQGIAGSAQLERQAGTAVEVERGMLIRNDRLRREVAAAHDAVRTVPADAS